MRSRDTRELLLGALVLVAGLSAFLNGLGGTFVFDDHVWIVEHPAIRSLRTSVLYSSRPLVGLSLYFNHAAGGLAPAGYHAVNIAIHLAAGFVLFLLGLRTLALRGNWEGIRPAILSASAAMIWIVHPLNTESVTYVIQRSESLMGLFYLLTMLCFVVGVHSPRRWHAMSVCFCALGMACKPVMVTAPLAVLLYDRFFVSGSIVRALRERKTFYALLGCTWLVPVVLLSAPHESSTSAGLGAGLLSPLRYLASQPAVIVHYLGLTAWPVRLCLDYGWSGPASFAEIAWPAAALSLALAATIVAARRKIPAAYAAVWFFLTLAPGSSIVPLADLAAEHRMYLPLIGVVFLFVLGAESVMRTLTRAATRGEGRATFPSFALAIGITLVLAVRTAKRNEDYHSRERMWSSVLDARPENPRAAFGMGTALLARGDYAGAAQHFRRVLEGIPDAETASRRDLSTVYAMVHNNLGAIHYMQGRLVPAEVHFREALKVSSRYPDAQRNLARVLERAGERQENGPAERGRSLRSVE